MKRIDTILAEFSEVLLGNNSVHIWYFHQGFQDGNAKLISSTSVTFNWSVVEIFSIRSNFLVSLYFCILLVLTFFNRCIKTFIEGFVSTSSFVPDDKKIPVQTSDDLFLRTFASTTLYFQIFLHIDPLRTKRYNYLPAHVLHIIIFALVFLRSLIIWIVRCQKSL